MTHTLPRPFMVLATQNPIEYEGTFPLPEAQLDRFLVRLRLGYPSINDEINILERQQFQHPVNDLQQVASAEELLQAQEAIKSIYVAPAVKHYIVELTHQTRQHADVYLGASPRGSLALFRTGQASAAMQGRDFVLPDDIKVLVKPALSHRVILGPAARLRDLSSDQVLDEILSVVPVPGGESKGQASRMTTGQKVVLALLALSIIAGLATGGKLYYRLSVFWAVLFFGSWLWSVLSLRGLKFTRSARSLRAQVGQIFEERFEVQNQNRFPRLWIEIRDQAPLPGADGSRVLTMLRGKQGRSYLSRVRLVRRGVFPLGPTGIATGDLFGLFPVEQTIPEKDSLLVYPMMVEVRGFPNPPGLVAGR